MPYSSHAGKDWIGRRLDAMTHVDRVLDVGVGAGTYSRFFRSQLDGAFWIGVEAWEPYLDQFRLRNLYDHLYIGDVRYLERELFSDVDVCFLGDVLEHMPKIDAKILVDQLLGSCRVVFVSVPIGHAPQGAIGGNPFERHLDQYTAEFFPKVFPNVVDSTVETDGIWTIGVALLSRDATVWPTFSTVARK